MQPAPAEQQRDRGADALYAKFFSGLADETRLRIVRCLLERPRAVGEIVTALGMSQSRISNQLACLKWCGYVHARRQGRNVVYELADPEISDLLTIAQRLVWANASHIAECSQVIS
jgi:DNA-binding transcriptional ArsR family regulator